MDRLKKINFIIALINLLPLALALFLFPIEKYAPDSGWLIIDVVRYYLGLYAMLMFWLIFFPLIFFASSIITIVSRVYGVLSRRFLNIDSAEKQSRFLIFLQFLALLLNSAFFLFNLFIFLQGVSNNFSLRSW